MAAVRDAGQARDDERRRRPTADAAAAPGGAARVPSLERSPFERRALRSLLLTIGAWAAAIIAAVPLVSVLYMLIVRGGSRLSLELFTELPPAGFEMGGGFGNAIVGTLVDGRHRRADQHSHRRARRRLPGRARTGQPPRRRPPASPPRR